RRLELRLREVGKQAVVAAVTVHDDDLLAPIARHLVGRLLQQLQLQSPAVGHRAWLMFRFENLPKVVLGKDDGVFLLGGIEGGVAHVEQIVAQGKMRAVLLQYAEGEQARTLRPGDAVAELGRRQLLPMHRQLVLSRWRLCPCDRGTECVDRNQKGSVHVSSRIAFEPSVMRLRESLGLAKSATPPGGCRYLPVRSSSGTPFRLHSVVQVCKVKHNRTGFT